MKRLFENYWIHFILFVVSILVILQDTLAPFANKISGTDSSVFIYAAHQIMKGQVMYHDLFDHKGPFLYLINIIGLTILGGNTTGIWLIELIAVFSTVLFIQKSVELFYNRFIAFMSTLSCVALVLVMYPAGNYPEIYAMQFISIALFYFLRYFKTKEIKSIDFILIGASFAFALLLKPNFTMVWIIGGLFVFTDLIRQKAYKQLLKIIVIITSSTLIILLPLFIYFISTNSLHDFIFCYWTFNKAYSDISLFGIIHRTWERLWFGEINSYVNVNIVVFVCLIAFSIFFNKSQEKVVSLFWVLLILFTSLALSPGDRTELYYYLIFVPILGMSYGFIYNLLYQKLSSSRKLFLIMIFLFLNYGALKSIGWRVSSAYKENCNFENLISTIKQSSLPADKIAVVGNNCSIYSFSKRESISKYAYVSPIIDIKLYGSKIRNEYCSDLQKKLPKVIIISKSFDSVSIPIFPSFLDKNYIRNKQKNYGLYECWVRKQAPVLK